jgi:hypothetical protein
MIVSDCSFSARLDSCPFKTSINVCAVDTNICAADTSFCEGPPSAVCFACPAGEVVAALNYNQRVPGKV